MISNKSHWVIAGIVLFLLFVNLSTRVTGQTVTLRGVVTDIETGEVLQGANIIVTAEGIETGTASLSTGEFEIKNLSIGTYTVTVSYIGYETKILSDLVFTVEETKSLHISLTPTDIPMNPITVSASRSPEKLLEAPASITVLYKDEIDERPALTLAEHLKAIPAVDFVQAGLNQSRVVIRGFNDLFSCKLYSLVDNRITRYPSTRLNQFQFIPTSNEDIERIEIVSGPSSALYGPNSAHGVMHILTKSPFESEGTQVSIGAGERSVMMWSLRHAGSYNDKLGYKISVKYYQGNDFEYFDPAEQAARQAAIEAGADPFALKIGDRDFRIKNIAAEGRLDYRLSSDLTFIFNGGYNRGNNIEPANVIHVQHKNASFSYLQARLHYKDLFLQAYSNIGNSGDSYFLSSGEQIVDESKLFVGQAQHRLLLWGRHKFTYGVDALLTRPDTKGTVHGRYENDDDINEIGAYLQSELTISSKLKSVVAARVDDHNVLDDLSFSPRAALVFKPRPADNFRLTYNRAFVTPRSIYLFSDFKGGVDIFGMGGLFEPILGFRPSTDIQIQGSPVRGFSFSHDSNNLFYFRSPFAPLDPRGLSTADYINLNDPIFTNVMWGVAHQGVLNDFLSNFQIMLNQQGLSPEQITALSQTFSAIVPQQVNDVNNVMRMLNLESGSFNLTQAVNNFPPLKITRTETFELGYKGILGDKIAVGLDIYHSRFKDFIGPWIVGTPNVFLEPNTLAAYLNRHFTEALSEPNSAELNSYLLAFDDPASGGNGDGSVVDELTNLFVNGTVFMPLGTVSPVEGFDPTAIYFLRHQFGNISLSGLDFSFSYFINKQWSFGGNYSYISQNFFENVDGIDNIVLNTPKHKLGALLHYENPRIGLGSQLRFRYVDSFRVEDGAYVGKVDSYSVLDFNVSYRLPFSNNTQIMLSILNFTDNKHREYLGVPEIGRLGIVRLKHAF